MFESVAFQCGVIAISVTTIFSCLHWILSVYNGVRVEKVALLQDPFFPIFKITRNSVELILGWLPMGSYVKIAGMVDESMDRGTETETEDKHKKIDMCSTIDTQQQTSSTYTTKENRQLSPLSRHMEHR